MSSLELAFDSSGAVVLLLVCLAAAASWLAYRHGAALSSRPLRIALTSLRTLLLSLILFLLLAPVLTLVTVSSRLPLLAVLLDNSESMRTPDHPVPRAERLSALLQSSALARTSATATIRWFTFGDRLRPWDHRPGNPPDLGEQASDLAGALRSLQESAQQEIAAAVVITDGIVTVGENPLRIAERLPFPLVTVGIGDSSEQRDLAITRVATNDRVFSGSRTPVDVHLKSSGFAAETVDVSLSTGSATLDRTTVTLSSGTRDYAVRLSYRPEGEGMRRYTVRVSSRPGELTAANNTQPFYVQILRSKMHVVLLAGGPSTDVSSVRQALSEDTDVELRTVVQKFPGGFFEEPLTSALLDSADCLVLVGFPTVSTPEAVLRLVSEALVRTRPPLLFITGRALDNSRLSAFGSVLPFTTALPAATEQLVSIQPVHSPGLPEILGVTTPPGDAGWLKLPPIFSTLSVYRARPEAILLATTRGTADPLLLASDLDRQKSIALLGYGIWRWRLMAQESAESSGLFARFLSASLRWLTAREDRGKFRVSPLTDFFRRGETAGFSAQVYDATDHPVDNATVRVTARSGAAIREADLRSVGSGRYEGGIDGLEEGEYSYAAVADVGGNRVGTREGKFSVGGMTLEFQETRANVQLLRQLADRTGGRFLTPETIDSLTPFLQSLRGFSATSTRHPVSLELWNWPTTLVLLVLLLAMEWFLRRRRGML